MVEEDVDVEDVEGGSVRELLDVVFDVVEEVVTAAALVLVPEIVEVVVVVAVGWNVRYAMPAVKARMKSIPMMFSRSPSLGPITIIFSLSR